ncbi:amidohydrolase family protein [Bacillus sp. S/N-304-OC-R1]|uniref:metal-dependent hydrolase family protein n=1 Tax=Bacillus sp. S/N-304-OC-R1 TaxID=2758034 RepID=UPI001C8EE1C3|nr:amidohydrolase family protein [Bacillus sp. S/N-304-OC-R1]MBY0121689.1 amidohydrolase family protein [Bacillus sp. S/N-304-OC-R1]
MIYKFMNIRILTCNDEEVIERGEILFNEKSIVGFGHKVDEGYSDVEEIDGTGLTILPGLIDSHVHLGMDASPDPFLSMKDEGPADIAYLAVQQGYEFLKAGITAIRNLGTRYNADIAYRNAVSSGKIIGPKVFAAGSPIVMTGGHGHVMAIEADGCDEVRKAARSQLKAGADLLKVMATGGVLTQGNEPGATQFSEEELRCICQEAAKVSKTTAAHTIGTEGIKNAIRAGVTTIEHAYLLDEEAVELMLKMGTYLVPTLLAPTLILDKPGTVPDYMISKVKKIINDHKISFQMAYKAGVPIAAGTDAGTPFNFPGLLAKELSLMIEYGMTPRKAIYSATLGAAKAVQMDHKIGSIQIGKEADLTIVRGNPLENIHNLCEPVYVFLNGRMVHNNTSHSKTHLEINS